MAGHEHLPNAARFLWRCLALATLATASAWGQVPELPGPRLGPAVTAPPGPPLGSQLTTPPSDPDEVGALTATSVAPEERVLEVRVVGNRTVPTNKILSKLQTRAGRPFDQPTYEKDVRRLASTKWFTDVRPARQATPQGVVITLQVVERPTLQYVKYVGNLQIKEKVLAKETELRAGAPLDVYAVQEGQRKITEYYQQKGYHRVHVRIAEGDKPTAAGAIYVIHEGPRTRVWSVRFTGNDPAIATAARLKTQIESKPPVLWLFKGYADRAKINEDIDRLTAYYRSLGYFRAQVGCRPEYDEDGDWATLTFHIQQGPRYTIRNITLLGNQQYSREQLVPGFQLNSGEFWDQKKMERDVNLLRDRYGSEGYVFADVQPEPRFLLEPGQLDLVYHISEGNRYRVGRINVHVQGEDPHTRHMAVLNRISLKPGQIVDIRKIRASQIKLRASNLFNNDPTKGEGPRIVFNPPTGEGETEVARGSGERSRFRGQSPDEAPRVVELDLTVDCPPYRPEVRESLQRPASGVTIRGQSPDEFGGRGLQSLSPQEAGRSQVRNPAAARPPVWTAPQRPVAASDQPRLRGQSPVSVWDAPGRGGNAGSGPVWGGQPMLNAAPGGGPGGSRIAQGPPGTVPSLAPRGAPLAPGSGAPLVESDPQGNILGNVEPLAPEAVPERFLPLDAYVEETQTGRLMFGVGINSDAGLIGNIMLDEGNFDILRFPTSLDDFRNGTAFRGAGQKFRLEAAPGTEVQRYLVSFQEPYLFDSPVSLSLSGFFYNRRYRDYSEERLGGRVGFGYQFSPDLSGSVQLGAQRVNILDPRIPTPPELDEVLGKSKLYTIRPSLAHDTRDSTFLPTQGHFIELAYEQGMGDFDYPRGLVDMRKYFVVNERPDGSGRHVLSVSGRLGVSGKDTPLYEHFFAGGFSTLRGFAFRGASPVSGGVIVGGEFMALGSVEYLFPITADDMLRGVVFCDFGTVEPTSNTNSDNFRAAPGFGFRVSIPALGPAPIALDFAFPVAQADTDDEQVFSFFIGFGRS